MNEENGPLYYFIIIAVIIGIAVVGVMINKIAGKDGVVEKVVSVENNFNKEDVLDKINYTITQKFIELNNQTKTDNQVLSEIYNENIIIDYLKELGYINEIYDEENNIIENKFKVSLANIYSDGENYLTTGEYTLEKNDENKFVVIYTIDEESEVIGELQIQQV